MSSARPGTPTGRRRHGGWRSTAVLALAATLVAGGCSEVPAAGDYAGTTITFSISVADQEKTAVREVLSRFEHQTGARVNLDLLSRFRDQPESGVKLVTSLGAAQLVDELVAGTRKGRSTIQLFAQDNLALAPLVQRGLVQDLSSVRVPAAVLPSLVPPRFGGRQYFLPFRPNVRITYANRERLRDAGVTAEPATVADLLQVARRLRDASGGPRMTLSLAKGDPAAVTVSEWIVSFGGNPLTLDDDGSLQAFGVLQQLWGEGLLARESLFAKFDTEVDNLRSGTAWLAQNWSFTSAQLAQRKMLKGFDVSAGWRGPRRAAHVIGGDVLGIPTGVTGRQRTAALALARFLMSRQAQEVLVRRNVWASIRNDAYGHVPGDQRPTFLAISQALADGWFRPPVPYWSEVTTAMNEAVDRILLQHEPVAPVLHELHARIASAARASGAPYPPPG